MGSPVLHEMSKHHSASFISEVIFPALSILHRPHSSSCAFNQRAAKRFLKRRRIQVQNYTVERSRGENEKYNCAVLHVSFITRYGQQTTLQFCKSLLSTNYSSDITHRAKRCVISKEIELLADLGTIIVIVTLERHKRN
jgi:hypothetical protein